MGTARCLYVRPEKLFCLHGKNSKRDTNFRRKLVTQTHQVLPTGSSTLASFFSSCSSFLFFPIPHVYIIILCHWWSTPSVPGPSWWPLGGFAGQCRGTRGDLQRRAELVRAGAGLCKAPLGRDRPRGFSDWRCFFLFVTPKRGGWGDWLSPFTVFFFPFDFFPVLFDQQRMVKKWDVSKKHRDSWGFTRPELGFD